MSEITFGIHHEFYGEAIINLRSNSKVCYVLNSDWNRVATMALALTYLEEACAQLWTYIGWIDNDDKLIVNFILAFVNRPVHDKRTFHLT